MQYKYPLKVYKHPNAFDAFMPGKFTTHILYKQHFHFINTMFSLQHCQFDKLEKCCQCFSWRHYQYFFKVVLCEVDAFPFSNGELWFPVFHEMNCGSIPLCNYSSSSHHVTSLLLHNNLPRCLNYVHEADVCNFLYIQY